MWHSFQNQFPQAINSWCLQFLPRLDDGAEGSTRDDGCHGAALNAESLRPRCGPGSRSHVDSSVLLLVKGIEPSTRRLRNQTAARKLPGTTEQDTGRFTA
jgi:hypothetical protein